MFNAQILRVSKLREKNYVNICLNKTTHNFNDSTNDFAGSITKDRKKRARGAIKRGIENEKNTRKTAVEHEF